MGDSGRGSPSTDSSTASSSCPAWATRSASCARPGWGASSSAWSGAAQEAEQPVQLDDGLPAGRLDRAQGLDRLVGLALHHPPGRPRLHAHHADVVGHDVVQLAGDAHPLVEHGLAGVLLPLPLELGGPRRPAPARRSRNERTAAPEQPRQGEDDGVVGQREALAERQPVGARLAKKTSRTTSPITPRQHGDEHAASDRAGGRGRRRCRSPAIRPSTVRSPPTPQARHPGSDTIRPTTKATIRRRRPRAGSAGARPAEA